MLKSKGVFSFNSLFILLILTTNVFAGDVLVLASSPYRIPYYKILSDIPKENRVVIINPEYFTDEDVQTYKNHFQSVISIKDYYNSAKLENAILNLNARKKIKRIVAADEDDILRAARARDYLNIPGQKFKSALAFRDKVVMKRILKEAGISVPVFKEVQNIFDVIEFGKQHGYPLILKPIRGAGSKKTYKLNSIEDLKKISEDNIFTSHHESNFEVEKFIDGDFYRIDGLVVDGKIIISYPSKNIVNCLEMVSDKIPFGGHILSESSPVVAELIAYAEKVLHALPTPLNTAFHLEVFKRASDGEIVFCEIASRVGGGFTIEEFEDHFSVNLMSEFIRLQAGLALEGNYDKKLIPKGVSGWVSFPKISGTVVSMPTKAPFDWITLYRPDVKVGESIQASEKLSQTIAEFRYISDSEQQAVHRYKELVNWFSKHCVVASVK